MSLSKSTKSDRAPRKGSRSPSGQTEADRLKGSYGRQAAGRQALVDAAVAVIGKVGYEKTTIAMITKKAKLSVGSFYLYFDSRQHLFDYMLPHLGQEMLDFIRSRVHGSGSFFEVDSRGLKAFFEFIDTRPGFFRVLSEGEAASPRGYEQYTSMMLQRFVVSLERGRAAGEIVGYNGKELVLIAYLLMGARTYIHRGFEKSESLRHDFPDWIIDTYVRFVRHGLTGAEKPEGKVRKPNGSKV